MALSDRNKLAGLHCREQLPLLSTGASENMHTARFLRNVPHACMICSLVFVGLISAESEFNVSGHVGSTAVLPCELPGEVTDHPNIRWFIKSESVFERRGQAAYQAAGYEGRVDVPEEELRKRNCSIVISNLKLNDAAVYKSYQIVRHTKRSGFSTTKRIPISSVNLTVSEPPVEVPSPSPEPAAGMTANGPQSLLMVFISWFLAQIFSVL